MEPKLSPQLSLIDFGDKNLNLTQPSEYKYEWQLAWDIVRIRNVFTFESHPTMNTNSIWFGNIFRV